MKSAAVPTVFIVDDDRGVRQAIQDLVESVGLRAEAFATAQEFLNRKWSGDPSCLVLDVRLPQMSGLDFQRKLADLGQPIPIIFITAHGDIPMSVRALKSGCSGVSDEAVSRPGFAGRNSAGSTARSCCARSTGRSQRIAQAVPGPDHARARSHGTGGNWNAQQADCLRNRS